MWSRFKIQEDKYTLQNKNNKGKLKQQTTNDNNKNSSHL